jgi:hypothetical protein
MMTTLSFITQEYFDELCIENYEVFEMNDKMEAVQETLQQLLRSSTSSSSKGSHSTTSSTKHLTLTYPDEMGHGIRKKIREFQESLRTLKSVLHTDNTVVECDATDTAGTVLQSNLEAIYECLNSTDNIALSKDDIVLFTHLFLIWDGFNVYFSLLHQLVIYHHCDWNNSIERILQTMHEMVSRSANDTLSQFQASTKVSIVSLTKLLEEEVDRIEFMQSRILLILSTIYSSILHYEANKMLWIACHTETSNFASILMKALQRSTCLGSTQPLPDTGDRPNIQTSICRTVTTMCTFDDFKVNNNDDTVCAAPVVQSGHTAVQALYQVGAVPIIHELVLQKCNNGNVDSVVTAFSALRAMAIQDDVVKCMDKIGVIDSAVQVLKDTLLTEFSSGVRNKERSQLVTAIIGLFRNVSANDDIKTTLCIGTNRNVIHSTIEAMDMYQDIPLLQEHGCGLFAAMALRKPKNATALVMAGVHNCVVNIAMRQHPTSVTVQRQGALAIRNIVARSPELRPMILNDCDTEVTLRTIAGTHLRCQDEVYAALRDLGLDAQSVHVHHAEDGTVTVQEGRAAFGVRNPNFRPDFTTSEATTTKQ